MRGEQGKLKEIAALKNKFNFRFLVDDAHGFGTLGPTGAGAGEEQGVQDEIDVRMRNLSDLSRESEKDVRDTMRETEDRIDNKMQKLDADLRETLQKALDNPLADG